MDNQLTSNAEALRLFFTEDIYLIKDESENALVDELTTINGYDQIETATIPVIAAVFSKELDTQTLQVEEPQPLLKKAIDFKYLGKNKRHILILVNDKLNEVSSEQGRELLRKLVKAITLTANDFALVNYANYDEVTYTALHDFFNCQWVLAFGVAAQQLGLMNQPMHQVIEHETSKLIFTSNLHDLDQDQVNKKILWASLQQLKLI